MVNVLGSLAVLCYNYAMYLSIIVTAHREGLFLHKTILSIKKSLKLLEKKDIEIILNLDNPDEQTKKVANHWSKDKMFKIFEVSYGNPADNRNDAVKKSSGKYVSIIDGDDLVSENWFKNSLKVIEGSKSPVVVRPEIHMQFGYNEHHQTVWRMRNSSDKATDAIQMSYWNLWTNAALTTRDVLLSTPFKAPINGYGFEDYLFCTELINKGIKNLIAKETILFYRRRDFSVTTQHQNTILDYSPLFDIEFFKSLPKSQHTPTKESLSSKCKREFKRFYRFAFDTAKKIGPINKAINPVARKILYKRSLNKIPDWLIEQWKKINTIENQLWPTEHAIFSLQFHPLTHNPFENSCGLIYQNICNQLQSDHLDYLFLAPNMSGRGGTEKLIANYIKALTKIHPTWKIGILSTRPLNDKTKEYFSDLNISVIDFGGLTSNISNYEKDIIWSRLLVQSKVKKLHIINDEYWYRWVAKHQKLIKGNNFEINISLFMREFTHEKNRIQTFSDPNLLEIWPVVNKVFTDNDKVISQALENNLFDREKFITHYQPEDIDKISSPKLIDNSKPLRVLWASRVSFQKRPDILKKVSNELDSNFVIDAYGIMEGSQYTPSFFKDSKVNYKGGFNGIQSIDISNYDIYLYTSETDGIPNILIEVAKAGLPVVASDIGGISELIKDNHSGIMVDLEDVRGYVKGLNFYRSNPEKAKKFAKNLQKTLKDQHSWREFEEKVKRDL